MSATTLGGRMAVCSLALACTIVLLPSSAFARHRDHQPPSTPTGLQVDASTQTSVSLSWTASTDTVGVAGYDVYVGPSLAGSTTATSYAATGLTCGTTYTFGVDAYDAAGNQSSRASVTAVTAACPTPPPPVAAGLRVSANQLLDANGNVVHLHGVNYSGSEYACIQGWGIFDGPSDAASVQAIASWHSNIVRIPLNEDCWLGINGAPTAYSGTNYRNAIVDYVSLLHQYGLYAELSLMWAAPGTNQATTQPAAPDEDHSPAMWSSLAATFKNDSNVMLAPWGETTVSADCFLNGGNCGAGYTSAGMQQAVNVIRQAGYNGVIVIPGIDYANDLSQWLSHEPADPLHQVVAEAHVYGKNTCDTTACFDSNYAPVAASVPVLFGETGETYDGSDCGSSYISTFMNWADAHGVGYEAWTWTTWGNCEALISDYSGTPYSAYGSWVKSHYLSLP